MFPGFEQRGYDTVQARFLAGLPREEDPEERSWCMVQDDEAGDVYYWDGGQRVQIERPREVRLLEL